MDTEKVKPWISSVKELLGQEAILQDAHSLSGYEVDGLRPEAVAVPEDADKLRSLIELASRNSLSLVPRGGGTQIHMGNIPSRLDLVVAMERFNRIMECDAENLTVSVQAGLTAGALNRLLKEKGLFLPLEPPWPDRATLGGSVAVNVSTPKDLLYGSWRDWILGASWIDPSGRQIKGGGKTVKNVSGYDISKLMIGSIGTLGIITELTFRLIPLPEASATIVATTSSLEALLEGAQPLACLGAPLAMIELLNGDALTRVLPDYGQGLDPASWGLAISCEGEREGVDEQSGRIVERLERAKEIRVERMDRQTGEAFQGRLRDRIGLGNPKEDTVVCRIGIKPSAAASLLQGLADRFAKTGRQWGLQADLGQGVFHLSFGFGESRPGGLIGEISSMTKSAGGYLVIERAPSRLKSRMDVWGIEPEEMVLMRWLKERFDPANAINPGRYVSAG